MKIEKYNFRKLKRLINDANDEKELVNMFYFNKKAVDFANSLIKPDYMMNKHYSLTTLDLLLMTEEADTISDVYNNLIKEYEKDFAFSWWQNYLACMSWEG